MVCIYCGNKTLITNTRTKTKSGQCWRRHKCQKCHATFTTTESYELEKSLLVEQKTGAIEPFLTNRLYLSIYQAVSHLDKSEISAGYLTQTVIDSLLSRKPLNPIISTSDIIDTVSLVLKRYNAAAAVRYYSLRTDMKSANDVKQLLRA